MAGESVTIWVPGHPKGKGRPRVGGGRIYTPPDTAREEKRVAAIASDAMQTAGLDPFVGPVSIVLVARYRIPPSWSKAKQVEARGHKFSPGKPDLDNVLKLALDALNGVVFDDDAQVAMIEAIKTFSDEPGIYIRARSDTEAGIEDGPDD